MNEAFLESLISAISLSMDAFAAALCLGACLRVPSRRQSFSMALICGLFQCLMPLAGWGLGYYFLETIAYFDHWVAFLLLAVVGGNMVRNSFAPPEECATTNPARLTALLYLGLATSIDAFAVGAGFALAAKPVFWLAALSGVITAALCFIGVRIGNRIGCRLGKRVELCGGALLILIGLNILRLHLWG